MRKLLFISMIIPAMLSATREPSKKDQASNRRQIKNSDKPLFEFSQQLDIPMDLVKQVVRIEMEKTGLDQKAAFEKFKQVSSAQEFYIIVGNTDPDIQRKLAIRAKSANQKQFKSSRARQNYGRTMHSNDLLDDQERLSDGEAPADAAFLALVFGK